MAGVSGIVSGIDTASLISQIMAAARRPLSTLRSQFDELGAKRTAMQEFNTLLGTLQTAVKAMDTSGELGAYSVSSSQPDNLGVTASGNPPAGVYNVRVHATAQGNIQRSQGFSSPFETLRRGNLRLTIDGQTTNVPIDSADGTNTPQGLADYINLNVSGARAYILDTGSGNDPFRLMVEASETGTDHAVSESIQNYGGGGTRLSLSQVQSASNAELTVSNTSVTTQSNQPVDVIPGITMDLKNATSGTATVRVARDTQKTADNVQGVVDAYNGLMEFINAQAGSSAGSGGPLAGDSTMRTINRRIQSVLNTAGGSGAISGLNALGLGSSQTGSLQFDAAAFKTALDTNPTDTMAAITGPNGLFGRLGSELDVIGDPVTGLIQPRLDSFASRMSDLTDRVESQEQRLVAYEEVIRAQFLSMELIMARYQSTGDYLEQQLAAWNSNK